MGALDHQQLGLAIITRAQREQNRSESRRALGRYLEPRPFRERSNEMNDTRVLEQLRDISHAVPRSPSPVPYSTSPPASAHPRNPPESATTFW